MFQAYRRGRHPPHRRTLPVEGGREKKRRGVGCGFERVAAPHPNPLPVNGEREKYRQDDPRFPLQRTIESHVVARSSRRAARDQVLAGGVAVAAEAAVLPIRRWTVSSVSASAAGLSQRMR